MPGLDVLCAGEALWDLGAPSGVPLERAESLRLAPGGAAVNVAVHLAKLGLAVGLAAAVGADPLGRALAAQVAARGVDTSLVEEAPQRTGLVFLEATEDGCRAVAYRQEDEPVAKLPSGWSARVLVLTGLMPSVAQRRIWREAAREARRAGARVVLDLNARPRVWRGQRYQASPLLHEVDVVRCGADDLIALGLDVPALRSAMGRKATLLVTDGPHPAWIAGRFGAFESSPRQARVPDPTGAGDAFTAGVVAALLEAGDGDVEERDFWRRAARRGHALARAKIARRS